MDDPLNEMSSKWIDFLLFYPFLFGLNLPVFYSTVRTADPLQQFQLHRQLSYPFSFILGF